MSEIVTAVPKAATPKKKKKSPLAAIVHPEGCTGCEVCIEFCPVDCLYKVPGPENPGEQHTNNVNGIVIVDEAHNAAPSGTGNFALDSQRTQALREIAQLTMPVMLVTGDRDEKYTAIARRMLERMRPEVAHVHLDGGHALPLEQPEVLGGLITAFATEHG